MSEAPGAKPPPKPVEDVRKEMQKESGDPDYMAKKVPLLDVMRKLQHLEGAFPKIKKMEDKVEKSAVNLAEINQKMRSVVNLEVFHEKFDQLTIQIRRQYLKDVEKYEDKTRDLMKSKVDVTDFNKRMSQKVNTYDYDRLVTRVQDLERLIKDTVQTMIEGQRREFKKALAQKASRDELDDLLNKKADLSRVESIGERVDHLETQINHMRLEEVDDESEEVVDSDEELDDYDEGAIDMTENKPNFAPPDSSAPFMGGGGGAALQKKPEEAKKPEEKKGEEGKEDAKKAEEGKKPEEAKAEVKKEEPAKPEEKKPTESVEKSQESKPEAKEEAKAEVQKSSEQG